MRTGAALHPTAQLARLAYRLAQTEDPPAASITSP